MFGTRVCLSQFSEFTQLELNDKSSIYFSNSVRDLGFLFDKTIGNLINISGITKKFIKFKSRIKLIHGLVLSNLDFCNSIYAGLLISLNSKLNEYIL